MATTPVLETSDNPNGVIKSINASILTGEPFNSNTNESCVVSITFARNASYKRKDSTLFSPVATTLTKAISLSIPCLSSVIFTAFFTGTSFCN